MSCKRSLALGLLILRHASIIFCRTISPDLPPASNESQDISQEDSSGEVDRNDIADFLLPLLKKAQDQGTEPEHLSLLQKVSDGDNVEILPLNPHHTNREGKSPLALILASNNDDKRYKKRHRLHKKQNKRKRKYKDNSEKSRYSDDNIVVMKLNVDVFDSSEERGEKLAGERDLAHVLENLEVNEKEGDDVLDEVLVDIDLDQETNDESVNVGIDKISEDFGNEVQGLASAEKLSEDVIGNDDSDAFELQEQSGISEILISDAELVEDNVQTDDDNPNQSVDVTDTLRNLLNIDLHELGLSSNDLDDFDTDVIERIGVLLDAETQENLSEQNCENRPAVMHGANVDGSYRKEHGKLPMQETHQVQETHKSYNLSFLFNR